MSDSESEDDCKSLNSNVDLGFVENSPRWKLESRFFPSKVGYKPAWLALSDGIPSSVDVLCSTCGKQKIFLCQLYAPIDKEESCFHRILYLFVCKTDGCIKSNSNSGFKVFRSQLSRTNKYYPFDPPVEEATWKSEICSELFGIKLCNVCGIRSTNHCGRCKIVHYCSKDHQVLDWKSGHKFACKDDSKNKKACEYSTLLFPELEVVIEHESDVIAEIEESNENNDSSLLSPPRRGTLQGVNCEEELASMAFSGDDKNFLKFREKIKNVPDQIIRYERDGSPLWISDNNVPPVTTASVPNCEYCGEKRIFEFQILPQLLNYLELDVSQNSLDWGTLAIFTCKNSCNDGPDYKEECLLKQDVNDSVEPSPLLQ